MGLIIPLIIFLIISFVGSVFLPTKKEGNIPVIPFYLSLYDACRGVGKTSFYNTRLRTLMEKHGALYIWSAGRWTVLVTSPKYLVRIFRNEQVVAKSGFNKKVPWGVFARLMGENITDTRGDLWKTFTSIMKPGIQRPFEIDSLVRKSSKLVDLFLQDQAMAQGGRGISTDLFVQRWAISIYAEYFLDVELGCLENPNVRLENIMGEFNNAVLPFGPLFTEFPFIEKAAWLFPSRRRAFALANEIETLIIDHTEPLTLKKPAPGNETKMIYHLQRARAEKSISEFHYRSNLKMMYIAGNENARFTIISALWELAQNQLIQDGLRDEILSRLPSTYTANDLNRLPLLTATVYETLRLYPPLSQLINRFTMEHFPLDGDVFLPQGSWVGWSAYGVQTATNVWGPSAREFNPYRWGQDIDEINAAFRLHQSRGNFIAFNGYTRRCLGSGFALMQLKVGLCEIIRNVSWIKDPEYKFSPTGRALLGPSDSKLIFKKVVSEGHSRSDTA
ncbi:hypothetical protein FQN57_001062 [Myotisia sp. PD_48]|nr:hypothetical protein FQN57_001062 [Myotisia sp. PD_48]